MSRVIKFRAWDTANFAMIDESYNDDHYILTIEQCKPVLLEYAGDDCARYVEIDSAIQQFTGLKDKNGIEIYEGDIVSNANWVCNLTVIFEDKLACWFLMDTDGYLEMLSDHNAESTIIGNTHQHPELNK